MDIETILQLALLVGKLVERAAQNGELTEEQRSALMDSAEKMFAATALAPPPPKAKEISGGTPA